MFSSGRRLRRPNFAKVGATAVGLLLAVVAGTAAPAFAFPDYVGTRALGMGQAGRADARANQGPLLNPSGMSLARLYTLEGAYQMITKNGGDLFHASVVDSTSGFNLAGGLYYNYRSNAPAGLTRFSGHEGGVALSFPFGGHVMLGVTGKYFRLSQDGASSSGVTMDAGVTVRPFSIVTLAAVGYNLRDIDLGPLAPLALGYGVAVRPLPDFVLLVDGYHDFTRGDPTRGVLTTVAGGAEFSFAQRAVLRAGGGRDGLSDRGFVTGGLAAVAEIGALEVSVRQDVSGDVKVTYIGAGLRLFVPQP
jgi:hypothetical protein